jgi:O-antigen ligase
MRRHHVRPAGIGLLAFCCGALQSLTVNLVGEIYAAELLLPLIGFAALCARNGDAVFRERVFWSLILALGVTLCGYVISDFVRDTRPDQYLRGWGRVLLLATDFAALCMLLRQDRRNLWWFALGMGIGGILHLRLILHTPISIWKFGYAEPMLLFAAAAGCFLPIRLAAAWLGVLGLTSMWYDFRSFAAICFLLATYMWLRAARPWQPLVGGGKSLRLLIAGGFAGALALATLAMTESDYSIHRRAESNAGRSAAFEVGLIAISRSPLIGYGSWTEDRELAELYLKRYLDKRGVRDPNADAGRHFTPHSQVLQSWVEGGVLGAAFFLMLGYQLLRSAKWSALARPVDMLTPLILYLLFSCAWNLFMSPFSAPHRIQIALGAAVLMLMDSEWRASRSAESRAAIARNRNPGVGSVPSALHKTAG